MSEDEQCYDEGDDGRCEECDRHAPLREFEGLLLCDRCIGDRLAEQGRED